MLAAAGKLVGSAVGGAHYHICVVWVGGVS